MAKVLRLSFAFHMPSDNMKDGDMVLDKGGKLVHSIFGFCDIRNFTDATEVRFTDAYGC